MARSYGTSILGAAVVAVIAFALYDLIPREPDEPLLIRPIIISAFLGLVFYWTNASNKREQELEQLSRDREAAAIAARFTPRGTDAARSSPAPRTPDDFVLLLRPFEGGEKLLIRQAVPLWVWILFAPVASAISNMRAMEHLDFVLGRALEETGPLVALGRAEKHPGPGKVCVPDSEWWGRFTALAEHARAIFLVPGTGENLTAEVAFIVPRHAHKLFFVRPGNTPDQIGVNRKSWTAIQAHFSALGVQFPGHGRMPLLFQVDTAGRLLETRRASFRRPKRLAKQIGRLLADVTPRRDPASPSTGETPTLGADCG
ncbi:MAG: hypothetical protein IPM29_04655 [Planctomycetes bacterium]|nr:hypothetical protein [Planctomycetota bacterium]